MNSAAEDGGGTAQAQTQARLRLRGRLGRRGEKDARRLLSSKDYVILARNYRTRFGEIDLVARDGATLVFVEVKTRRSSSAYRPRQSWLGGQRLRLERSALDYLKRTGLRQVSYRFELVEVVRSFWRLYAIAQHRVGLPLLKLHSKQAISKTLAHDQLGRQ